MVIKSVNEFQSKNINTRELSRKGQARRILYILITIGAAMVVLMSMYEGLKHILFPNITIWESHVMTVFFTSSITILFSYFVIRKLSLYNKKLKNDVGNHIQFEQKITQQNEFLNLVLNSLKYPFYVVNTSDYRVMIESCV